jgi:hypothetical protein
MTGLLPQIAPNPVHVSRTQGHSLNASTGQHLREESFATNRFREGLAFAPRIARASHHVSPLLIAGR